MQPCCACDVIDDAGRHLHFEKPVQRIVSLAPDITELLFAAGAGSYVIGVIKGSDFPVAATRLPIVGNYSQLNYEVILSLHPDLVITWGNVNRERLESLGLNVFVSDQHKLGDIPSTLKRLGCLMHTEKIADQAADEFLKKLKTLQKVPKHRAKVFYQIWSRPLITVNRNSWINEVIYLCGGKNIFANLRNVAPQVNIEAVIEADPDVIVGSIPEKSLRKFWYEWKDISAVRQKKLFSIDPDLIERASPRILKGAEQLCSFLSD